VLACGALATELRAVLAADGLSDAVEVDYLPAPLHNRPEQIVPAVEERLAAVAADRPVLLGYADCGTGGGLDRLIERSGGRLRRLPGDHCYSFFAGADRFAVLHAEELGTFFLTDFLAKHFDAVVWGGLGIDRHPELRDLYFAAYRRVVLITQSGDDGVVAAAERAAGRLGLPLVVDRAGLEPFATSVRVGLAAPAGEAAR
jgi:hypothetical protein